MKQISLVRSQIVAPVAEIVARAGANPERLLEATGLPPGLLYRPEQPVPLHRTVDFLELTARYAGDPLVTCHALAADGERSPGQVASVRFARLPTPLERLEDFVGQANGLTTEDIRLVARGDLLWIDHVWSGAFIPPGWQAEQYVLAFFDTAFKQMLGGDWSPAGLCLIEPREPPSWPANWTECEPRFGCRKTAIAINRRDLARAVDSAPVSVARTAVDVEGLRDGYAASADRVAHSVLSVVEAEGTALPTVASAFGLNARTFQRRLADVGLGFSDLVDDFRYRRAIRALRETEILISELALELGYEHPPNFARAFKSRVGVSPSAYRRSLTEVGAAPTP